VLHKTLIALTAAVALSCVPMATSASAAGHPGGHGGGHAAGGHAMGGHATGGHAAGGYARGNHVARYGGGYRGGGYRTGPIYDSCYGYNPGYDCPGYGVPLVGGLIDGVLGGYGPF
jgi:hypothetical protein